jgi:leader peptidase (prepilin peptidase)/N-methyltransferase
MLYLLTFFFGLIIGSFLNVCISRIPKGESVVSPPSRCESCGVRLKPWDLVPVLSWLLLRGRCRYCGAKVSPKYLIVELLTGSLFVSLLAVKGLSAELIPYLTLTSILVVVGFTDLEHYLIPNKVIIAGFVLGAGLHIFFRHLDWKDIFLGFLAGGSILYLLAVLSKGGMGGGDIKLAALLGFYLGWQGVLLTLFLGALLASVTGIWLIILGKKSRKDPLPFGVFLSIAAMISMLYGGNILTWYLNAL